MPRANDSDKKTSPENMLLFQIVTMPPEAPCDGIKANLSKRRGHKTLSISISKEGILDSWRQITVHPLALIAFERAKCLSGELRPRIFQQSTFQLCKSTIDEISKRKSTQIAQAEEVESSGPLARAASDSSSAGMAHSWVPTACIVAIGVGGGTTSS